MASIVVIPPPIRVDVDEDADPHVFASVTDAPITRVYWNDGGELEVEFPVDLSGEQFDEVIRIARDQPMLFDPGTTAILPAQMIPADGWTQFENVAFEQLFGDQIQGKIAVLGELWVARYATTEPGETTPAAGSNVLHMSATDESALLKALFPTGGMDEDGQPLYESFFTIPQNAFDPNGQRIPAVFRGRVLADDITVLQGVTLQGSSDDGYISRIAPGARLQLDNVVGDPDTEPQVSFGPKTRRWPGLTNRAAELGWGTHNGLVVQARYNEDKSVTARFIDPDTGLLDHSVDLPIPYAHLAGFTAGGGYLYCHGKVLYDSPWTLNRFTPNGALTGNDVGAGTDSVRVSALGFDGGRVRLLGLGGSRSTVRVYGTGLELQETINLPGLDTNKRAVGVGVDWVAYGNEFAWLSGTGSTRTIDASRSWYSYEGSMRGAGQLPDGQMAATNQSGNLYVYNGDRPTSGSTLYASWTKKNTPTGRETRQSPVAVRDWPTRLFATIETDSLPPGVDDVEIYASGTSESRTSMFLVPGIPAGQTQVTISAAPTSGPNPPSASGFTDGTGTSPGEIVSDVRDSAGEPLMFIGGNGEFRAMVGSVGQSGSPSVTTVQGSNEEHTVVFGTGFRAAPVVTMTLGPGADPQQVDPPTLRAISATQFTFAVRRTGGSGNVTVQWHAQPATQ